MTALHCCLGLQLQHRSLVRVALLASCHHFSLFLMQGQPRVDSFRPSGKGTSEQSSCKAPMGKAPMGKAPMGKAPLCPRLLWGFSVTVEGSEISGKERKGKGKCFCSRFWLLCIAHKLMLYHCPPAEVFLLSPCCTPGILTGRLHAGSRF